MIYTLTLNPSLDYIMSVDTLLIGETNRSTKEHLHIGGKGINVSIVLNNLGVETTALGFLGGFTGVYLQEALNQYACIQPAFLWHELDTRINIKIKNTIETEINGAGNELPKKLINDLENCLLSITATDFIVLSGSMAKGMPADWYVKIAKQLHEHAIPFAVDIASMDMLDLLQFKPLFIKPNQSELEKIFNVKISSIAEIIPYAQEMLTLGACNVIVSCGSAGAILVTTDAVYQATVPKGELVDSVGAGDAMVAGFIYGLLEKKLPIQRAFQYACSCGSATAYSTHLATKETIEKLYPEVLVEQIK